MSSRYARVHRLLRILTLVQSERGWNVRRLSLELDMSERNVYRDLKMLEGAGVPLYHDPDTDGYIVRRDFFMPPIELTLEESLAVLTLSERVGGGDGVAFTSPAARASAKLRACLPRNIQEALETVTPHIEVDLAASQPGEGFADVYEQVRAAIATRRALRCRYESVRSGIGNAGIGASKESEEPFLFKPYCLFFGQRAWYAVGYHGGRNQQRTLKLSRFSQCELTDQPYLIPDEFSLRKYLGKAWRMIAGDGPVQRIELRFTPQVAETVADTHWHDTQQIEWNDDGGITFRCEVAGLDEIVWWVLSYGPNCRVIRPRALTSRVRKLIQATAEQYDYGRAATDTLSSAGDAI